MLAVFRQAYILGVSAGPAMGRKPATHRGRGRFFDILKSRQLRQGCRGREREVQGGQPGAERRPADRLRHLAHGYAAKAVQPGPASSSPWI